MDCTDFAQTIMIYTHGWLKEKVFTKDLSLDNSLKYPMLCKWNIHVNLTLLPKILSHTAKFGHTLFLLIFNPFWSERLMTKCFISKKHRLCLVWYIFFLMIFSFHWTLKIHISHPIYCKPTVIQLKVSALNLYLIKLAFFFSFKWILYDLNL